jgi:signal transduction histidine kinase/ActR/RegA family two-component response regulator
MRQGLLESALKRGRALWRQHGVIIIAMAACAMIMIGFAWLMAYAGLTMRQIAVERETLLIHRVIDRRMEKLQHDLVSITIWNPMYQNSVVRTDRAWLDENLGRYLHLYAGHDLTVAFDQQDRPFYASLGGVQTSPEQLRAFVVAAEPLVRQVRDREAAKIKAAPTSLGFARSVAAGGPLKVGGQVYFAQATTVVPEASYRGALIGRQPIVLSAITVGPAFLNTLSTEYDVEAPSLVGLESHKAGWVELRGPDGKPFGAITWTPDRPGLAALQRAKWIILTVALMIIAILALLVRGMSRLITQLRQAREEAFAANRAKSEFLANISHEIRTPLNGVLGMAQAMSADALNPAQRERLGVIQESGSSLLALLNDVLDISKIQAGKLEIEAEAFNLHDLCRDVCGTFQGLAEAKNLDLDFSVETGDRRLWRGDALRIRQVLSNLISNAVKFTEHGSVRLLVTPTADGLAFSVVDTGIGLNEDQISRLFQKFSQADASTTRRHGGSGLGLAISHDLVRLMGGTLRVISHPGRGSTFAFSLQLEQLRQLARSAPSEAEEWERREAVARALPVMRLLVAEDNLTNQVVLRALLQPLELDLHMVSNGAEAVRAYEDGVFDLVLMDIQMPLMSGVEAAQTIRRREAITGRAHTPIVALSANVMTHHLAEYRAAGIDAHVGKPIEVEKLYAVLEKVAKGAPLEIQLAV